MELSGTRLRRAMGLPADQTGRPRRSARRSRVIVGWSQAYNRSEKAVESFV
jgi:hypothetical protein